MNKYSLALIVPYFGKLPNYFDLWLTSCKYNSTVNWIIFTDDTTEFDYPENVQVIYTTFSLIKEKIQSYFDFKISLENPYKLCDFKVAYGEVFHEYLINYDFWGYCDLDLIWGDIRRFITDEVLEAHDKILDSGHFTLFRNDSEITSAYKNLPSKNCYHYKEVFSSIQSFAFDEWGKNRGINRIFLNNNLKIFYEDLVFSDIKINKYALRSTREDYGYKEKRAIEKAKRNRAYKFIEGKLFQYALNKTGSLVRDEVMYVHFQKRPMKKEQILNSSNINSFVVTPPNKIKYYKEEITIGFLENECKERKLYIHYYRIRLNNLKKKIIFFVCKKK